MVQGIISLNEDRLQAFPGGIVVACLLLLTVIAGAGAQQVKEYSWKDKPIYVGAPPTFKQPEIYWHDSDMSFDLDASSDDWSVLVKQGNTPAERVPLPAILEQVNAIHRAAPNRAVLLADLSAGARFVGIIGTSPAKLLDSFWSSAAPSLSPDNRYVLFIRFFPMHGADNYDYQYRLYDVLGTRALNWPDRPAHDAPPNSPTNFDDTLAGVPVYSLKPGELGRQNTNIEEGEVHQSASDFIWTADSSKVVFADAQAGVISLVVVSMPTVAGGKPHTSVYPLAGSENVCLNTSEAACYNRNVRSLAWDGDNIKVALKMWPQHGKAIDVDLTIPLSKFVPASK
ncbi:MAG: hypothetical protein ABR907_11610 [Terracidiphilus sp.]|jgi:hypothetical protein